MKDLLSRMLSKRNWRDEYEVKPDLTPSPSDMLWACYFCETEQFDLLQERIAAANNRPVSTAQMAEMNRFAVRCRKAVEWIAHNSGIELGLPANSRYARSKLDDLKRLTYGTEWRDGFHHVLHQLSRTNDSDIKMPKPSEW